MSNSTPTRSTTPFTNPSLATWLLGSTQAAWVWLLVRLYLGYTWVSSALPKLSDPAWTQTGEALKGFWQYAVMIPEAPARPAIAFDWYRAFIQMMLDGGHYVWFAKLVVAGELLVGIALILGLFTGITALIGGFMNWNFMMAGSASVNPVLFPLAMLLFLAWRVAGYWGLDRWLLPALGTPWQPGEMIAPRDKEAMPSAT